VTVSEYEAVFLPAGTRDGAQLWTPTDLARGPWSPDAMHGGAPAALLARAVEGHDPGPAHFVVRLTIDLLRPVPLVPVSIHARTTRPGRKVQWVEATMVADGVEVARAHGLRLRTDPDLELPLPDLAAPSVVPWSESKPFAIRFEGKDNRVSTDGFWDVVETRVARGSWVDPGSSTVWFRLKLPICAGETPSPLQRAAAAADFGNGVSSELPRGEFLFINADLSIHLYRHPVGEWVAVDGISSLNPAGIGVAACTLHDETGPFGRSLQSLLVGNL